MQLDDLVSRSCVIGLSYFEHDGTLLRQTQYAGVVRSVDAENGITIALQHADPAVAAADFILPPNLQAWFKAPPGHYRNTESGVDVNNPDYLVTWDIHRTQETRTEGQHTWWEWVPNVQSPRVGQS